jgi:hypothetical protein
MTRPDRRALALATVTALWMLGTSTTAASAASPCLNAALRTGASTTLPDCRVYEQVSPVDKGGIAAYPSPGQEDPAQASPSGEDPAVAYLNFAAFPGAVGNTAYSAGHVSRRTTDGWRTTEMSPPVPAGGVMLTNEAHYAFSEDLSQVVLQVPFAALAAGATPNAFNLFLRHTDGTLLFAEFVAAGNVDRRTVRA